MGQRNLQPQPQPTRQLEWRSESSQQPSDPLLADTRPGRPGPQTSSQQLGPLAQQAKRWAQDLWEFNRSRLIIVAVLVGAIALGAVWVTSRSGSTASQAQPEAVIPLAQPVTTQPPPQQIVVHIAGAVAEPGVYSLSSKARVYELILEAGGTTPTADTSNVNLAQPLVDGTRVCIPDAQPQDNCAPNCCQGQNQSSPSAGPQLINPNSATPAELESLPGIGPVLASEIEAYRQQGGRFSSAEDLLQIPGIGAATLKRFESLLFFP